MSNRFWSFILSWSRLGINAALFLVATRFLSLSEIGLFATAFAPVRMTQTLHKAGITDAIVIIGKSARRCDTLFALSVASGTALALLFALLGLLFSPLLLALSAIPLLNGLGAVSDGLLRKSLALRALALRTAAAQILAAGAALWMLANGWGAGALAGFAIGNAALTCALTLWLAGWHPITRPRLRYVSLILAKTGQISGRALLGSVQIPLAQLLVGLALGPAAAGAFQIATRMAELIDALTLSPLRFVALPQMRGKSTSSLRMVLREHLRIAATLSIWVWAGTILTAPALLTLAVGPLHASSATPVLRALAGYGLLGALTMPLTQALLAQSHTKLAMHRSALLLTLATLLTLPALLISATAVAIALTCAATLTTLWLLPRAATAVRLGASDLTPLIPPTLAGSLMTITLAVAPLPFPAQILCGTAVFAAALAVLRLPHWHTA